MFCVCLQKKNPLMKHIRNVSWQLGEIIPDFELGKTTCALYLRFDWSYAESVLVDVHKGNTV